METSRSVYLRYQLYRTSLTWNGSGSRMLSPCRSLTQHWCPRREGTEQNYDGIDAEIRQRGRSRRDREFASLAFRLRCCRIPIGDDVCQFGKGADDGESGFYPCNHRLTSPAPLTSVRLAERLAGVDGGLGRSLLIQTPQVSGIDVS